MKKHFLWVLPLLLIAGGLMACGFFLIRWISGGQCQALLEQKTAEALHVKAELGSLSWRWFGLASSQFHATGSETTVLKSLEASSLQARLKPALLLQGIWGVEEISMEGLKLHLGSATHREMTAKIALSPVPSLPKWLPSLVAIDVIRSREADIFFDLAGARPIEILGTSLEIRPEGDETRFEARGGIVRTPFLPDLNLTTARLRRTRDGVLLTGADLGFPGDGTLRLEGDFPDNDSPQTMKGRWDHLPIPSLLPLLAGKVIGILDGEGAAIWETNSLQSLVGTLNASDVTITDLPMLEKLASLTGIDQFRHLPVQEAHASFSRSGAITIWSNVVLESKGFLKLTGEATAMESGSLEGTFQLGITSAVASMIPGAGELLGLTQHDGYFWMPLHVGGTLSHPTQDFTSRLGLDAVPAGVVGLIGQGLKAIGIGNAPPVEVSTNAPATNAPSPPSNSTPTDTTNAAKTLQQGAGDVINVLGGFLK